jgi:hypothetical protein
MVPDVICTFYFTVGPVTTIVGANTQVKWFTLFLTVTYPTASGVTITSLIACEMGPSFAITAFVTIAVEAYLVCCRCDCCDVCVHDFDATLYILLLLVKVVVLLVLVAAAASIHSIAFVFVSTGGSAARAQYTDTHRTTSRKYN